MRYICTSIFFMFLTLSAIFFFLVCFRYLYLLPRYIVINFSLPQMFFNFRMLKLMILNKLIKPFFDKLIFCLSCNKTILISKIPISLRMISLINFSLIDITCILWIKEHKYFRMLTITIIN